MRLHAVGHAVRVDRTLIGRIATRDVEDRADSWRVWNDPAVPDAAGYLGVMTRNDASWQIDVPTVRGVRGLDYLADGDVVAVDPTGFVRTLYRRASRHNFILMTEQCNSYCLMCSQPPRRIDDSDRIHDHFRLVDLIDPDTEELGVTGGEPTLFGVDFLRLIDHCRTRLPSTALHVLTNGRLFYYRSFAEQLGAIGHPDLVLGIPLYSDNDFDHDYIVQADGAFEETVLGLHNLDRYGVVVEIRVVLHRLTIPRLRQLAEFIARNFPFAAHVALMGMEMFGLVHQNLSELWIDPADYQRELAAATETLAQAGMHVSLYNQQLCVLDRTLWPFARKSISDWKTIYLDECNCCAARDRCGGLFQSAAKKHSAHIHALADGTFPGSGPSTDVSTPVPQPATPQNTPDRDA